MEYVQKTCLLHWCQQGQAPNSRVVYAQPKEHGCKFTYACSHSPNKQHMERSSLSLSSSTREHHPSLTPKLTLAAAPGNTQPKNPAIPGLAPSSLLPSTMGTTTTVILGLFLSHVSTRLSGGGGGAGGA